MLIINAKTYREAMGSAGLELVKKLDTACKGSPVKVLLAVNALDIEKASKLVKHIGIIAQHSDPVGYGAHTGHLPPEELKMRGACGTLLNHSEHPLPNLLLGDALNLCRAHFGDTVIVCTPSFEHACMLDAKWDPKLIAFEPPELIGGDVSVSSSKPDIIKKVVDISAGRQILVGAGVKTVDDVKRSLDLGAVGVLISSGIIKSADPASTLSSFLQAWS